MKKRINKLIILGILSISFIGRGFLSSAESMSKPTIKGEITNDKIKIYNEQVNKYNQWVDEKYISDLDLVKQQNEEIDKHNAEENKKLAEIQFRNAEKQAQYDIELVQYNKDKEKEEKILKKGFASVEAYNDYINTGWNNKANTSVEKNKVNFFNIENSYKVEHGGEVSSNNAGAWSSDSDDLEPAKVKVHIEHNFPEANLSYTKDLEILETDTIIFYPAGNQLDSVEPNTVLFYMNSDENHTMGYWWQGNSTLMCTANISTNIWACGDGHVVSYREGKKHAGDSTDIDMIYNYVWTPLTIYPTYNVPKEPKLESEEYTPDIKEHIPDPIKEPYLEYMDLLPEDEPEVTGGNADPGPNPEVTGGNSNPSPSPNPRSEVTNGNANPEPESNSEITNDNPNNSNSNESEPEITKNNTEPKINPDSDSHKNDTDKKQKSKKNKKKKKSSKKDLNKKAISKSAFKKAPPKTEIIKVNNLSPTARRANTGDNNKIAFRAIIILSCIGLFFGLLIDTINKRR